MSEEILIPAAPAALWPLLTEGRHFQAWYAFGGATIEPRPGGAMTLRWDEHGEFRAVVESLQPPELFSFRWLPAPGPLVEITLRAENGGTRVRIVETGALDHFPNREEMLRAGRERTPAGRMVEPDDIAGAVAFLCSDDAAMICGQTIIVDGGFSLPA